MMATPEYGSSGNMDRDAKSDDIEFPSGQSLEAFIT